MLPDEDAPYILETTCIRYMLSVDEARRKWQARAAEGDEVAAECLAHSYPHGVDIDARAHVASHIMMPINAELGYCVLCGHRMQPFRDRRLIHFEAKTWCIHCWEYLGMDTDGQAHRKPYDEMLDRHKSRCIHPEHEHPYTYPHCINRCPYQYGQQALI